MEFQDLINYNIKCLRVELGLTQEQFAEKIGLSSRAVSKLECNHHMPKAKTLDEICKTFNITPDILCLSPQKDSSKTDIIRNINIHLNNLNKSQLNQIMQIIETFNNK